MGNKKKKLIFLANRVNEFVSNSGTRLSTFCSNHNVIVSRAQKKNWSIKLRTRGEQRVSAFGLRIQETVPDCHGVARLFMMADPLVGKNSLPCLWAVVYPQTNKLQNSSLVSLKIIQLWMELPLKLPNPPENLFVCCYYTTNPPKLIRTLLCMQEVWHSHDRVAAARAEHSTTEKQLSKNS